MVGFGECETQLLGALREEEVVQVLEGSADHEVLHAQGREGARKGDGELGRHCVGDIAID